MAMKCFARMIGQNMRQGDGCAWGFRATGLPRQTLKPQAFRP